MAMTMAMSSTTLLLSGPRPSPSSSSHAYLCFANPCLSKSASQFIFSPKFSARNGARRSLKLRVVSQQTPDAEADSVGTAGVAAIVGGLVANPVVAWSLFTLKTTGCGLPPGPGGVFGAVEGVSYLAILGVIGWSTYTKVKTGSGLPSGPYGLLGAVEGLSFLSLLGILVVFVLQYVDYGFIPGPVPSDLCFGTP